MEHHHTNQVAKEEDLIPQPPQRDGAEEDKAPSCVNLRYFFRWLAAGFVPITSIIIIISDQPNILVMS